MLLLSDTVSDRQFGSMQDTFSKEFHTFKPDKHLRWLPLMGHVRMEVELEDRIIEKECSPLAAAVIELFLEKRSL
jgi:anaphase-promoting complex subunit 2